MERNLAILCLVASCLTASFLVEAKVASEEFLYKQKAVLQLLWRPGQPDLLPELTNVGQSYNIRDNLNSYKNQEAVEEFLTRFETDFIPPSDIYSVFYDNHVELAKALFKVFYYANDFETFYKTAAWARLNVNEGLYAHALNVAILHIPVTRGLSIYSLHDRYPSLFWDDQVITDPVAEWSRIYAATNLTVAGELIVPAGYSDEYKQYSANPKQDLAYLAEDVSMNDAGYLAHLSNVFWLSTEEFPDVQEVRGDRYFINYKTESARNYLGRLSNGLGPVGPVDWNAPMTLGYHPHINYGPPKEFPPRDVGATIPSHNADLLKKVEETFTAILTAIETGYLVAADGTSVRLSYTAEGVNILGNLVEGNGNSVNIKSYSSFDRNLKILLGFAPAVVGEWEVLPSMLQHFGINQKDPIYWALSKNILEIYERFVSKLPKYTHQQLAVSGVKINDVSIDDITTFFAEYDWEVPNLVNLNNVDDKPVVKVRQSRLDHQPYSYIVSVTSEEELKVTVSTFLAPVYDSNGVEIPLTENYMNFVPLEEFNVDLKIGSNTIERSSADLAADDVRGDDIYFKVVKALETGEAYEIPEKSNGFHPQRMSIPKGTEEGFPVQLLVFIRSADSDVPLGFPVDRPLSHRFANLSNAYIKKLNIYHV